MKKFYQMKSFDQMSICDHHNVTLTFVQVCPCLLELCVVPDDDLEFLHVEVQVLVYVVAGRRVVYQQNQFGVRFGGTRHWSGCGGVGWYKGGAAGTPETGV